MKPKQTSWGAEQAASNPSLSEHRSLALKLLLGQFSEHQKRHVLDLGPAVGANVSFFSNYLCALSIADLHRSLKKSSALISEESPTLDRALATVLPKAPEDGYDFIIAWDLLDYLTKPQVAALGRQLFKLARPGALLFAMVSTRPEIPEQPRRFQIREEGNLAYVSPQPHRRSAPLYKEPELHQLLPGWGVDVTYLLRNGVQEYVLIKEAPAQSELDWELD